MNNRFELPWPSGHDNTQHIGCQLERFSLTVGYQMLILNSQAHATGQGQFNGCWSPPLHVGHQVNINVELKNNVGPVISYASAVTTTLPKVIIRLANISLTAPMVGWHYRYRPYGYVVAAMPVAGRLAPAAAGD